MPFLSPDMKYLMVGYPRTPMRWQVRSPSAVQSTSTIRTDDESAKLAPSLFQSGAMDLQWPHQGARNFTKAFLPEPSTSESNVRSEACRTPLPAEASASIPRKSARRMAAPPRTEVRMVASEDAGACDASGDLQRTRPRRRRSKKSR